MRLDFSISFESVSEFVLHWASKYSYPHQWKYDDNIGKPLDPSRLMLLYEWKNGGKISAAKTESIKRNYPAELLKNAEERYLNPKCDGGPIWNIFYLHVLEPGKWPIFDQHTHRAMRYIKSGSIEELPSAKSKVLDVYREEYLPFFDEFPFEDNRRVDKALFSFGRFLKSVKKFV